MRKHSPARHERAVLGEENSGVIDVVPTVALVVSKLDEEAHGSVIDSTTVFLVSTRDALDDIPAEACGLKV